jgi:hypothetical protein
VNGVIVHLKDGSKWVCILTDEVIEKVKAQPDDENPFNAGEDAVEQLATLRAFFGHENVTPYVPGHADERSH